MDSTHKLAIRLVEKSKAMECVLMAERQTSGIGKFGRSWESPRGNLFASLLKRFPLPQQEPGQLSLTTAAAVHKAISRYIPSNLYLHWPNDVYHQKSKIAGILITVINSWAVVSIGINVNCSPGLDNTASLKEVCGGEVVASERMLKDVLIALRGFLYVHDFSCVKKYWLRYVDVIGHSVTVKNGENSLVGICRGVDNSGRFILENSGRNLFISSGDMFSGAEGMVVRCE